MMLPPPSSDKLVEGLLGDYSKNLLGRMAERWGYSAGLSKKRLVEALSAALRDEGRLSERVGQLTVAQQRAIAMMGADGGQRWPLRTVTAYVLHEGHADAADQVYELVLMGLLLLVPAWHDKMLVADADLVLSACPVRLPAALPRLPRPASRPLALEATPPEALEAQHLADPGLMSGALVRLLQVTRERTIRLTKDDHVAKNQHKVIERALGDAVPAALVITLGRRAGLFRSTGGALVAAAPERWPAAGLPLVRRLIEAYYAEHNAIEQLSATDPWRQEVPRPCIAAGAGSVRVALLTTLARLPQGSWVDLDRLADHLLEVDPGLGHTRLLSSFPAGGWEYSPYYHYRHSNLDVDGAPQDPVERRDQRKLIYAAATLGLARLGLVDLGRRPGAAALEPQCPALPPGQEVDQSPGRGRGRGRPARRPRGAATAAVRATPPSAPASSGLALRLSALGAAALQGQVQADGCELVVGADFELLAPLDRTPCDVLARLAQVAEPLSAHPTDPVRRLRLTRESVQGALPLVPLEAIVADLERGRGGVPQNVRTTLQDWARQLDRVQVLLGWDLLELPDRAARDAAQAGLSEAVAVAVADRFLLIDSAQAPSFVETASAGSEEVGEPRLFDYQADTARCLTVTPDLVLTVDAARSDLFVAHALERCAVPLPAEGAAARRYRLDRDKIADSSDADRVLELLARRSVGPLPALARVCLEAWAGKETGLTLERLTVLRAPGAAAGALAAHPEVAACLHGSLGRDLLVVDPKQRKELDRVLAGLGLAPRGALELMPLAEFVRPARPALSSFSAEVARRLGGSPESAAAAWGGDDWDGEVGEDDDDWDDDDGEYDAEALTELVVAVFQRLSEVRSFAAAQPHFDIFNTLTDLDMIVELAVEDRRMPVRGYVSEIRFEAGQICFSIEPVEGGRRVKVPISDIIALRVLEA
jgi:hypothetical protein